MQDMLLLLMPRTSSGHESLGSHSTILWAQLCYSKCNLLSFCWSMDRLTVPEVVSRYTALHANKGAQGSRICAAMEITDLNHGLHIMKW